MKRLFLSARLSGIWLLLTKPYFVVVTSENKGGLNCRFNVNHRSFRLLMKALDPVLAQHEAESDLLGEVKSILDKQPNPPQ